MSAGLISEEQLQQALTGQQGTDKRLGEVLVETGMVGELELTQILSNQLSVAWVSLDLVQFPLELLSLVPSDVASRLTVIPVHFRRGKKREKILYIAMKDPTDVTVMEEVSRVTGMHIRPLIAPPTDLRRTIQEQYFDEAPED